MIWVKKRFKKEFGFNNILFSKRNFGSENFLVKKCFESRKKNILGRKIFLALNNHFGPNKVFGTPSDTSQTSFRHFQDMLQTTSIPDTFQKPS